MPQDVSLKLQAPIQSIKEGELSIEDITEATDTPFARIGSPNKSAKPKIHSVRPTTYHSTYLYTLKAELHSACQPYHSPPTVLRFATCYHAFRRNYAPACPSETLGPNPKYKSWREKYHLRTKQNPALGGLGSPNLADKPQTPPPDRPPIFQPTCCTH